jgi:hypothetical protein
MWLVSRLRGHGYRRMGIYTSHLAALAKRDTGSQIVQCLVQSTQRQHIIADIFALDPDLMPVPLQRKSDYRLQNHMSSAQHKSARFISHCPDNFLTYPNCM